MMMMIRKTAILDYRQSFLSCFKASFTFFGARILGNISTNRPNVFGRILVSTWLIAIILICEGFKGTFLYRLISSPKSHYTSFEELANAPENIQILVPHNSPTLNSLRKMDNPSIKKILQRATYEEFDDMLNPIHITNVIRGNTVMIHSTFKYQIFRNLGVEGEFSFHDLTSDRVDDVRLMRMTYSHAKNISKL